MNRLRIGMISMDAAMIGAFVEALKEGRKVPITGEDGYLSTRVAIAAYASADKGVPVVLSAPKPNN